MNDIELKALELKRKAWEVLDGKAEADLLFQELYRLERQSPEFLDSVASQLEADNGRWSATSALPDAVVKRDKSTQRIEEISFHALDEHSRQSTGAIKNEQKRGLVASEHEIDSDLVTGTDHEVGSEHKTGSDHKSAPDHKTEFKHIAMPRNAELEMSKAAEEYCERLSVIVWRSDYGDRAWIEDFAKELNKKKDEK